MDTNYQNFAELVTQYVAAARSSASTVSAQPISYPQYDPRDQSNYYQANLPNQSYQHQTYTYQQSQSYAQPYNAHHYQQHVTHHLTSVDENPNRIPYDRRRERSMGYSRSNHVNKSNYNHANFNANKSVKPKPQDNTIICDVCKVSCAGDLPYREHLNGKQHKKKELAQKKLDSLMMKPDKVIETKQVKQNKDADAALSDANKIFIRCVVCEVTCCGKESYDSHLRGTKHKKVVSLKEKLGSSGPSSMQTAGKTLSSSSHDTSSSIESKSLKVLGAPVINFVKGGRLHTIENTIVEIPETTDEDDGVNTLDHSFDERKLIIDDSTIISSFESSANNNLEKQSQIELAADRNECDTEVLKNESTAEELINEKESEDPTEKTGTSHSLYIGEDYVKEIVSDNIIVGYNCSLCSCQFNSISAKIDHLKGRRHKFKYSQVNPPEKNSSVKRKSKKNREQLKKKKLNKQVDSASQSSNDDTTLINTSSNIMTQSKIHPIHSSTQQTEPEIPTEYDCYLLKILEEIKPKEEVLEDLDHIATTVQRALKLISDEKMIDSQSDASFDKANSLRGIIEVGICRNLMISTDEHIDLVLLCESWPSESFLHRIANALPEKLKSVAPDDEYSIETIVPQASIIVHYYTHHPNNLQLFVRILLSSPDVEKKKYIVGNFSKDCNQLSKDMNIQPLDDVPCLNWLAEIRRRNWASKCIDDFDLITNLIKLVRVLGLKSDIWKKINLWTVQVLVEHLIASNPKNEYLHIYHAIRRLFEALAGGVLMPSGALILDPCEQEPTSISKIYSSKEIEDITREAQLMLSLIAFGKIDRIFGEASLENTPVDQ